MIVAHFSSFIHICIYKYTNINLLVYEGYAGGKTKERKDIMMTEKGWLDAVRFCVYLRVRVCHVSECMRGMWIVCVFVWVRLSVNCACAPSFCVWKEHWHRKHFHFLKHFTYHTTAPLIRLYSIIQSHHFYPDDKLNFFFARTSINTAAEKFIVFPHFNKSVCSFNFKSLLTNC